MTILVNCFFSKFSINMSDIANHKTYALHIVCMHCCTYFLFHAIHALQFKPNLIQMSFPTFSLGLLLFCTYDNHHTKYYSSETLKISLYIIIAAMIKRFLPLHSLWEVHSLNNEVIPTQWMRTDRMSTCCANLCWSKNDNRIAVHRFPNIFPLGIIMTCTCDEADTIMHQSHIVLFYATAQIITHSHIHTKTETARHLVIYFETSMPHNIILNLKRMWQKNNKCSKPY